VASGELHGKLPGERVLARRFNVNAKTLSKALTDLAAEGLLDRSIGRGTYVKGSAPRRRQGGRWLVFATPAQATSAIVNKLRLINHDLHVHSDRQWDLRPSFLQPFTTVISLDSQVPSRSSATWSCGNMNVVTVDYQPKVFSMHAVLDDTFTNASNLARTLLMDGHRSFVRRRVARQRVVAKALRETAKRVAPDVTIDVVDPAAANLASLTAGTVVCESPAVASMVSAPTSRTCRA
jgi:hypothetical protein